MRRLKTRRQTKKSKKKSFDNKKKKDFKKLLEGIIHKENVDYKSGYTDKYDQVFYIPGPCRGQYGWHQGGISGIALYAIFATIYNLVNKNPKSKWDCFTISEHFASRDKFLDRYRFANTWLKVEVLYSVCVVRATFINGLDTDDDTIIACPYRVQAIMNRAIEYIKANKTFIKNNNK